MSRPLPSLESALSILRHKRTKRVPRPTPSVNKPLQPLILRFEQQFAGLSSPFLGLSTRWTEIVGATLGKICEPVRIIAARSGQTLEIRVAGAYAALLQHQSTVIIDRINLYLGGKEIERLKFIQGPLKVKPESERPLLKPLNASEELALRQSLETVDNEKLKKTLLELGRAVLQKEKSTLKVTQT